MSITLNAEHGVLDLKYTYDVGAGARMLSVPPLIPFDNFISLVLRMNSLEAGFNEANLLIQSDSHCNYYISICDTGRLINVQELKAPFERLSFKVPIDGFIIITNSSFNISKIKNVICPINKRAVIEMDGLICQAISGYYILGKRNSVTSMAFSSPAQLDVMSGLIPSSNKQAEVELNPGMSIVHKYQFSLMLQLISGEKIYCNNYMELLPGGSLRTGVY